MRLLFPGFFDAAGIAEFGATSRTIYFGRAHEFSKADGKPSATGHGASQKWRGI